MKTVNSFLNSPHKCPTEKKQKESLSTIQELQMPQMTNSERMIQSFDSLKEESLCRARGFYLCISGSLSFRGFEIMLFCQSCWRVSVMHTMYFGGGAWHTGLWYYWYEAVTHNFSFSNAKVACFSPDQRVFLKPDLARKEHFNTPLGGWSPSSPDWWHLMKRNVLD